MAERYNDVKECRIRIDELCEKAYEKDPRNAKNL